MPHQSHERVAGGPAGKLIGRIKRALGAVADDPRLDREGRLQEQQAGAELRAARHDAEAREKSAESDLDRETLDNEAERARLEIEMQQAARREAAEQQRARADEIDDAADRLDPERSSA